MNESISGVVLGVLGLVGLSYLAVKVKKNQRRLQRTIGVVDDRLSNEIQYLFDLADSGKLKTYRPSTYHGS